MKNKKRKQKKARSILVLDMILSCKGGYMRDRRMRRSKEKEQSWEKEWEE